MSVNVEATFWELDDERRKALRDWYQEAKMPAQGILCLEKKLAAALEKCLGTERPAREFPLNPFDGAEEHHQITMEVMWDIHDKEFALRQAEINRLDAEVRRREEPITKLAENCSAMMCAPFSAGIHRRLPPRELRDQVYDYLWEQPYVDDVDAAISIPPRFFKNAPNNPVSQKQNMILRMPFFADARFVGEDFAKEAATFFFRTLTDAELHYQFVSTYLRIERLGNMEFRPREVTRRLIIDIAWSISQQKEVSYPDLQDTLDSLLTLPVRDDLAIVIYLGRDLQYSRNMFCVLDMIKPVFQALVQKGVNIKVLGYRFFTPRWRDSADNEPGGVTKRPCTTAEQLNYYFDRTSDEWFEVKEAELKAIEQAVRRQKCLEILDVMRHNILDAGVVSQDQDKTLDRSLLE